MDSVEELMAKVIDYHKAGYQQCARGFAMPEDEKLLAEIRSLASGMAVPLQDRDGERYRWLKKGGKPAVGYLTLVEDSADWDKVIDAAIKREKNQNADSSHFSAPSGPSRQG